MDTSALIDRYFDLAARPDTGAYFAQCADDAVVEDEGRATARGLDRFGHDGHIRREPADRDGDRPG